MPVPFRAAAPADEPKPLSPSGNPLGRGNLRIRFLRAIGPRPTLSRISKAATPRGATVTRPIDASTLLAIRPSASGGAVNQGKPEVPGRPRDAQEKGPPHGGSPV